MEKRFAVSDEVLEISQLWTVNGRKIRLGDDAPENREPDSAAAGISRSNAIFVTMCPTGIESGLSKSHLPLPHLGHQHPPIKKILTFEFYKQPIFRNAARQ